MVGNSVTSVFDLLPEIWDGILPFLNSIDFHTVINTSVEWRQMLERNKSNKLLSLVLPLVVEYLPIQTILSCREVSSKWKTEIDNIIQFHSVCFSSTKYVESQRRQRLYSDIATINKRYHFNKTPDISHFMNQMSYNRDANQNPFPTRRISIKICSNDNDAELPDSYLKLQQLLLQFGHHVWRLNVTIFGGGTGATKLVWILNHLPNLKYLDVRALLFYRKNNEPQLLKASMLPHLNNLVGLHLNAGSGVSSFPQAFIQRYGNQLDEFSCGGDVLSMKGKMLHNSMSKLQHLFVGQMGESQEFKKIVQKSKSFM
ncbi:hypothetical protein Ocin01_11850 [Orchesella cincta]|uniref:F-box domain-containing protein n=1 Tax=Orchesella cincta TaxID=48709 RepID=A0A1D2MP25_ORCCI|nr:hypothetical protein Ocin01_11850 [Orchesella cincta]